MKSRVLSRKELVTQKQVHISFIHLCQDISHLHKKKGGKKSLQSLLSIISEILPLRLKGALLLSIKDMQISLSLPPSVSLAHLHFNKLALLNALGRIKVEVCFECIQRGVVIGA